MSKFESLTDEQKMLVRIREAIDRYGLVPVTDDAVMLSLDLSNFVRNISPDGSYDLNEEGEK